jgi:hypothetical protein
MGSLVLPGNTPAPAQQGYSGLQGYGSYGGPKKQKQSTNEIAYPEKGFYDSSGDKTVRDIRMIKL